MSALFGIGLITGIAAVGILQVLLAIDTGSVWWPTVVTFVWVFIFVSVTGWVIEEMTMMEDR